MAIFQRMNPVISRGHGNQIEAEEALQNYLGVVGIAVAERRGAYRRARRQEAGGQSHRHRRKEEDEDQTKRIGLAIPGWALDKDNKLVPAKKRLPVSKRIAQRKSKRITVKRGKR